MNLNIMYSCNENYVIQAGVSIISLCENNKDFSNINIYFIEDHLSPKSKKQLEEIAEYYHRNLYFYEFDKVCKNLAVKKGDRHPNTIYSKLFLNFLEKVEKILYIDCDCIITNSFYNLWQTDMKENIIGGVAMPYSNAIKDFAGVAKDSQFICDGFVLINLEKWRQYNMEEKCSNLIKENDGNPHMLSEGILNKICCGKILILEPKYNLMPFMLLFNTKKITKYFNIKQYYSEEKIREAITNPIVIHFINELFNRPWYKNCDHPLKAEYLKYYFMSPWKEKELENGDIPIKTKIVRLCLKHLPTWLFIFIRNIFTKIKFKMC